MAKLPEKPKKTRDYARPTRAKAHRPEAPEADPALDALLNPGIARGTAGMGSGTGLQPPPDNSFDRRADRRGEHTARKSVTKGFEEAPQRGYVGNEPLDINAELRKALGYDQADPSKPLIGETPQEQTDQENAQPDQPMRDEISDISEPRREKRVKHRPTPQPVTLGVTASMQALEKLLREGRAEFAESGGTAVWTPHRPPRPEKSEGGVPIVLKSDMVPKGDQPSAIKDLVEGANRKDRTQVLLGVTGSGKTFTMAKVIEATQRPSTLR